MTEHRIGPDGRDDDLTRALRGLYAAPADAAYWGALEARIVARVADAGAAGAGGAASMSWWQPMARWARVGAIAAAIAVAISGAALWRASEVRAQSSLEAILLQSNTPPAQLAAAAGATPDADAVLRYVLAP